jgi:hypothetical protein
MNVFNLCSTEAVWREILDDHRLNAVMSISASGNRWGIRGKVNAIPG